MTANRPIIHAAAETLAQSPWQSVTLGAGWKAAIGIRPPAVCSVGQVVYLSGVIVRNAGGSLSNMATIPRKHCPTRMNQFIGAGVAGNGGAFALYVSPEGILQCKGYSGAGNTAGPAYSFSCCYVPMRD